jgi:hypothetical protein
MPRPVEDRSDVGGAAQFNNIGPVPLSRLPNIVSVPLNIVSDPSRFPISDPSRFAFPQYRTRPASLSPNIGPVPLPDPSRFAFPIE